MNKNSKWLGIALLGAALGLMAWQSHDQAERMKAWQTQQAKIEASEKKDAAEAAASATPVAITAASPAPAATNNNAAMTIKAVSTLEKESLYTLENSLLKVTFTSRGGAIRSVAFKEYPAVQGAPEPYVLQASEKLPFMSISTAANVDGVDLARYNVVAQTADSITFARNVAPGLSVERRYVLTAPDAQGKRTAAGYVLNHTLTWKNGSNQALQLPAYFVNIGLAVPTASDPQHIFLNFGYYDGKSSHFIGLPYFKGGGFLFWSKPAQTQFQQSGNIVWATVKNQFFALVATPNTPAMGVFAQPVLGEAVENQRTQESIAGFIQFAGPTIPANATSTTEISNYMGPKEYARLASLGQRQDEVMQWGWPIFAFFSKLFISMLNWIAHAVGNYGVAIILLTLIIRAAMWPFTAAAARASKKMAAIQPLLKEIQTKYKDNPEKQQRETLRIFQENQVNPLAGCLPALMQIPVFIGFFYMLRSAAELRFESFLWIHDLSMPDTIAHIGGFPINPLPLIMLVTMYFQIKLTPSSGDPEQQKIMQFTPFLFSFLLYNFSAGLTLYWTLSNIVSIIQQIIVNRSTLPPTDSTLGKGGKGGSGDVIDLKNFSVKKGV